ncbi:hypothetical protein QQ045_005625 [Rhodiola kirilowii]
MEGEISPDLVQNLITKRKRSERQRATSEEYLVPEEEDREAAKCLIHMSRGSWAHLNIRNEVMYECNACKRSFDSYQALGGHRARCHKKRKTTTIDEEITLRPVCHRVRECLICGAEFPSGQALGGHMRRHRVTIETKADSVSGTQSHVKTEEDSVNGFEWLDLNLPPAASSEEEINQLALGSKKHHQPKQLQVSAPPLVDCHY